MNRGPNSLRAEEGKLGNSNSSDAYCVYRKAFRGPLGQRRYFGRVKKIKLGYHPRRATCIVRKHSVVQSKTTYNPAKPCRPLAGQGAFTEGLPIR